MVDIIHKLGVRAPLPRVYEALSTAAGVAGWWTTETQGSADASGSLEVRFSDHGEEKGRMSFAVEAKGPERTLRWRCTAGPEEWLGTEITFTLELRGEQTIVLFGHRNWREPCEFMAHCSMKWATFLLSLRALLETGTGKPAPDDLKIDDWN